MARRGRGRLGRGAARAGVGRADRSVHQRRADDDHDAAAQARRPAGGRDGDRRRLPDGLSVRACASARPAPTVRLRLTLLYGLTFLITGAVLLTIGYVLVRHNLGRRPRSAAARSRGPGSAFPRPPGRRAPDSPRAGVRQGGPRPAGERLAAPAGARVRAGAGGDDRSSRPAPAGCSPGGRWRPLREITATARRVSGENLGERIDLDRAGRRAARAGRHVRRDARTARSRVLQPAPLRGQRIARAPHPAGDHAHRDRRGAGRRAARARGSCGGWGRRCGRRSTAASG